MILKNKLALLVILSHCVLFAQRNVKDSIIGTPLIGIHYGAAWPSEDLVQRFGFLNQIGASAGYKTSKNWHYAIDGNFIFGNQIKETGLFDDLKDEKGNITDVNGDIGKVLTFARGFNANVTVGKLFNVLSPNENSGILVDFGIGYLQHKIRIETQDQVIPSLELEYRKGYDRFTSGINLHQFVGYSFMANRGYYNFYGGFYIMEGFTKNRRTLFFDQPEIPVSTATRLDLMYGLRVGWYIPIYKRKPKDFYLD